MKTLKPYSVHTLSELKKMGYVTAGTLMGKRRFRVPLLDTDSYGRTLLYRKTPSTNGNDIIAFSTWRNTQDRRDPRGFVQNPKHPDWIAVRNKYTDDDRPRLWGKIPLALARQAYKLDGVEGVHALVGGHGNVQEDTEAVYVSLLRGDEYHTYRLGKKAKGVPVKYRLVVESYNDKRDDMTKKVVCTGGYVKVCNHWNHKTNVSDNVELQTNSFFTAMNYNDWGGPIILKKGETRKQWGQRIRTQRAARIRADLKKDGFTFLSGT